MNQFEFRNGKLYIEDISAEAIIKKYGSPLYVYSSASLVANFNELKQAFSELDPLICFSVKSCSNLSILKLLIDQGSGMDVVSGGELFRALKAGASPDKIVFAGVGKSFQEICEAVEVGVGFFNVESEGELHRIQEIASSMSERVRVAIRVNPDVSDSSTPEKTSTGGRHTKFGIPLENARKLFVPNYLSNVDVVGLHIHLGSPIYNDQTYVAAIEVIESFIRGVVELGGRVEFFNLGGGFPTKYGFEKQDVISLTAMGRTISSRLKHLKMQGTKFIIEPGRCISANSGILLTSMEYLKRGWNHDIAIVDAGMNVLLRPSLYDASHFIWPIKYQNFSGGWDTLSLLDKSDFPVVDVVGPICETGDYFALGRNLPGLHNASALAIFSCGAYGMTMASQYNSRGRPSELMIEGAQVRVIRAAENYDDLISHEISYLKDL